MKKVLILVLALVLAFSCVQLVACTSKVTDIKFKEDTVPSQVTRGSTVDYSKIKIIVTLEGGNETELSLTDKNVNYTAINVSTTGAKTLTVSYGGKSAQTVINVVEKDVDDYVVTGFENTDGYNAYLNAKTEKDNKDEEFLNKETPYTVGFNNGYVFAPKTTFVIDVDSDPIISSNVQTTFKLYLKNGSTYTELSETEVNSYVSKVENNTYYFTEDANDKMFKLEVTLADTYETILDASKQTVTQEFKVIEGYNIYEALGMSVLDNLNNKSWADIKKTKLDWDNGKALSEFANVSKVIIHNNINVTKSDLPENYFWKEGEEALASGNRSYMDALDSTPAQLKDLLVGSLKETYLGEDWEDGRPNHSRGLYVNDGISIYGNYLTISYETGYTENAGTGEVTAPNGGIYVVSGYKSSKADIYPEGHWNFIAYRCKTAEAIKHTASVENVFFVGNAKKTTNTNIPCGLGMISSELATLEVNNTIGNQWYFNFNIDLNTAALRLDSSKFFDSFSQMIYTWNGKSMEVTNTTLKRAGGPLIILQCPSYASGSSGNLDGWANAMDFTIDSTNDLENWLAGEEVWFKINAPGADSTIEQLFGLNDLMDGQPLNKNYAKTEDGVTKYNAIMLLIPDPDDIFNNQKHLAGSITIGDNVYSMDDPILNLRDTAQKLADLATTLKTMFGDSLDDASKQALDILIGGATGLKDNADLLPLTVAPLYKSGNNYAYANPAGNEGEKVFVVPAVVKGLTQLSGGAQQVVGVLQAQLDEVNKGIAQLEAAGQDASAYKATAAQITALIAQWQGWIASVKPMTDLAEGVDITSETADQQILANWMQGWTNSEDYAALWINPGGLTNPANLTYNYFMLVFAENPAA